MPFPDRSLPTVLVLACLGSACADRTPPPPGDSAPAAVPVTLEIAKNLTYGGVMDQAVTLVDGKYERFPTDSTPGDRAVVTLADRGYAIHDIDGDGVDDGAFLLVANFGGSGVFTYLVAVSGRDGTPKSIYTAALGDRTQVSLLAASDSSVTVEYVGVGAADAACCPTQKVRQVFPMRGDTLVEVVTEDLGRISAADLAGEWQLAWLDWEEPAPAGVAVTARFDNGRVSGNGGCNNYSGPFQVGDASLEVTAGPMVSTRMACPEPAMEVESRYLGSLQEVVRWGWAQGMLALNYRVEGGIGTLLYRRR